MKPTCADYVIEALSRLEERDSLSPLTSLVKDEIHKLKRELEFLQFYIRVLGKWNEASIRKDTQLGSLRKSHVKFTIRKARKRLYVSAAEALDTGEFEEWSNAAFELQNVIQFCKVEIKQNCLYLLEDLLEVNFSGRQLHQFFQSLCRSLGNLISSHLTNNHGIDDAEKVIYSLKRKANLLVTISDFAERCSCSRKDMNKLRIHTQAWAYKASCVSILLWATGEKDEKIKSRLNFTIPDLLGCSPDGLWVYLGALKASRPSFRDRLLMGEVISNLVDFLLEKLPGGLSEGAARNLRAGLVLLIIFRSSNDFVGHNGSAIQAVDDVINDFMSSIYSEELEGHLGKLMERIQEMKGHMRQFDVQVNESAHVQLPTTNLMGSIDFIMVTKKKFDFIIDYWKDMLDSKKYSVPFAANQFRIVNDELLSLRPLLLSFSELQKNDDEIKALWTQIANVSHRTQNALKSFFSSWSTPLWQATICLSDLVDEIELMKVELKRILSQYNHTSRVPKVESSDRPIIRIQDKISRLNDAVVGFVSQAKEVTDLLTSNSRPLSVVSIFGLPGQGKTTLARKVYDSLKIKGHFHAYAWCIVSHEFRTEKILRDILRDVALPSDDISKVDDEDLAHRVSQRLSERPYLIVFDDIWEISAWNKIKNSFPNDENGSRVVFTSRNDKLASQANLRYHNYKLSELDTEESWELLQQKLSLKHGLSSSFAPVGRQIAEGCKGLPLAIVLIAGLLCEELGDLGWWKKIAENLGEHMVTEGCMDIIALSYKHLPEYLKPCFLYFGSFQEDTTIKIKKLLQLWITEGFVQKHGNGMNRQEDIAMRCLMELVARSLVNLDSRSSDGNIKTCRLHDLLHNFCIAQIHEEGFMQMANGDSFSPKHYRLCIQTKDRRSIFSSAPTMGGLHSLVFSSNNPYHLDPDLDFPWIHFRLLQVFDLEEVKFIHFPNEITQLFFLNYLAIWCTTRSIPDEIANLEYLETFCIKGNEHEVRLPVRFWEDMKSLRHVDIGRCVADTFPDDSQLDNVQTFSAPSLSRGENAERLLRSIPNVRNLRCRFYESWNRDKKRNQLPNIDSASNLESLKVFYIGKVLLPAELKLPSTLKKLTLVNFRLPWSYASMLAKLENLVVLKLLENAFSGEKWDAEEIVFPKLEFLKLYKLNVGQWNATDDTFPALKQLLVQRCRNLQEIPYMFAEINGLEKIQVLWCNPDAESSASGIQAQRIEDGKEELEVHIAGNDLDTDFSISEFWNL